VIYLQHRLAEAGVPAPARIGVMPAVEPRVQADLLDELRAAFPMARVEVLGADRHPIDVLVVPFTRRLHRRFVRDKTALVGRAVRAPAPVIVFFDVAHRRSEVVRRGRVPGWYLRRLLEVVSIALARRWRWRTS
jgi:hypothetical protein